MPSGSSSSFVSLLVHEGRTIVEVAAQAGHAPTMTLSTYAHVIAELEGAESVPAATQIVNARREGVPVSYPAQRRHRTWKSCLRADLGSFTLGLLADGAFVRKWPCVLC